MTAIRRMSQRRAQNLSMVAAGAAATFGATAVATATRASAHVDRKLAPRVAFGARASGRRAHDALSPVAKWYTLMPAAIVAGAVLARRREHRAAGVALAASGIVATVVAKACDALLPQPPVPAGHRDKPGKAVFPSGHALLSSATSFTACYVLSRERIVNTAPAAVAAGGFVVVNTAIKLGVRKHWMSDVAGGLAAGLAIAAGTCAVYEAMRE
jgi:membrane-associated phospholipid phosphatase